MISDTHNQHGKLRVPDGIDAVIHCGDESDSGDEWLNEPEAREFLDWYSALDVDMKVFVPGNHSIAVERGLVRPDQYPRLRFLIHDQTEIGGLTIFGTPYTPTFFNWAYMRDHHDLDIIWQSIPDEIDILISHGPPKGYLDVTRDFDTRKPIHVGSKSLTRHVKQRIQPMIHAFGHIHDETGIKNFGVKQESRTAFINCSCCNLRGRLVNHGIIVEIDVPNRKLSYERN